LKVGDRIVGVMDVQSAHPYAFSTTVSEPCASWPINWALQWSTRSYSQRRRSTCPTASASSHHDLRCSGTTLEEALDSAVTGLQVTLGGDRVAILLMDREKKMLEVRAAAGYSEDILRLQVPIGSGITGWAAAHRRALRIDNVAEDPRYIQASAIQARNWPSLCSTVMRCWAC